MTRKELNKLCQTPDWRWATPEGAELHTLLLGLLCTFREKLEWLEEAETLSLRLRSGRGQTRARKSAAEKPVDLNRQNRQFNRKRLYGKRQAHRI